MAVTSLGEVVSLTFMATALGMDAFSVSLGMGMQKLRLKRIAIIGLVIGLFHMIMPFIGILLGNLISHQIGSLTTLFGGLLLVGIGAQMFFSAFQKEDSNVFQPIGIGLILFALTVSLDSFSVGLSLGIQSIQLYLVVLIFGITSAVLTWLGLLIGKKVQSYLGVYSELLGGSILAAFGLFFIFGV